MVMIPAISDDVICKSFDAQGDTVGARAPQVVMRWSCFGKGSVPPDIRRCGVANGARGAL